MSTTTGKPRTPSSFAAENRKLRDRAQKAERERDTAQAALHEVNRMILAVWLRGRLIDPADFDARHGINKVTDTDGRINWTHLATLVDQLLTDSPHLRAHDDNPWKAGTTAIEWFLTG